MNNLDSKISKISFSISEVAEIIGVKPYVLRYWEKEFRQIKPQKNNVGVRKYSKEDIEIIGQIKSLLYDQQFTIKGAKSYLKSQNEKREFMPPAFDDGESIFKSELEKIKSKIETLLKSINED